MPIDTPVEYLEVDSVPLVWWIELTDLSPLWDGADHNDEDLHINGASGERELAQFLEPLTVVLPGVVYGDRDQDGDTVSGDAERRQQLFDNLAYLRSEVCVEPGVLPSTRTATLYLPDGTSSLTGDVRISRRLDIRPLSPFAVEVSLAIKVLAGELTESGS